MPLDLLLGQHRLRLAWLKFFQVSLEPQPDSGNQENHTKQTGDDGDHPPSPDAAVPDHAEPERGERSIAGKREAPFSENKERRQEETGSVEREEHPQPHQESQLEKRPDVGDSERKKRQRRGEGCGKNPVAGVGEGQPERLPGVRPRNPLRIEPVIDVDGVVGAQADDEGGEGKGNYVDGGEKQSRCPQGQEGAAEDDDRNEQCRQEPPVGEIKEPQDHHEGREDASDNVPLHGRFVDDRAQVSPGAGDGDPGTGPSLIYCGNQLPGKGHVLHRPGRFGDNDEDPSVPGEKIGRRSVQIQGLACLPEPGKDQVPEPQGIG